MIYDDETDEFVLSTGRRFYALNGHLGLTWVDPSIATYGSDGVVGLDHLLDPDNDERFTADERREIAEAMIAAWARWAAA